MNTFGQVFRLTTFGESHGTAVGGIVDGCPAGMVLDLAFVDEELRRRREGDSTTPQPITTRREKDQVEWFSGLYEGTTLGTPIAFAIRNTDTRPEDYEALRHLYRPGHADYTYQQKYGIRDHRGGGRASGRETAARVVGGAIAKQWLHTLGVAIATQVDGHSIACTLTGLPPGVGEPVFDRLNARLAYAMLSIPSAMAFVMGASPTDWQLPADQFPDAWSMKSGEWRVESGEWRTDSHAPLTATNHCGGVQGGISNGMPVQFHVGFHLPVTQPDGMLCRNEEGHLLPVSPHGRHDGNHLSRLPVIVESMAALTLADLLQQSLKPPLAPHQSL